MNGHAKAPCPICGHGAHIWGWQDHIGSEIDCEICSRFRISHVLKSFLEKGRDNGTLDDSLLRYLSAYTRQATDPPTILAENWEQLATQHRDTPFSVKASKLLNVLRDRSTQRGEMVTLDDRDYPLADAGSATELDHIVSDLTQQGLVDGVYPLYRLTPAGWRSIDLVAPVGVQRIFLSHAAADKALAAYVSDQIIKHLPSAVVFVASRAGDIPTGVKWLDEVERELVTRDTCVILITPNSVGRPWLWFETGVAWFRQSRILPICVGISKGDVPMPLASRQVLALDDPKDAQQLFRDLAVELERPDEFVNSVASLFEKPGS